MTRSERHESLYRKFQAAEGIPVYRGSAIDDIRHLDVASWPRHALLQ